MDTSWSSYENYSTRHPPAPLDRQPAVPLLAVAHDLTATTREALVGGYLQAVLSHPLPLLAERLVRAMAGPVEAAQQIVLPLDTHTKSV